MKILIKKIIVLSALCLITFFALVDLSKAEEFNYTDLVLSFENINIIAAGETKITELNITNNSNYLLDNARLVLETKCNNEPFDGKGIDIWFSSVNDPYDWKLPDSDSVWQDGKLTFSGFEIDSGDSTFCLKIKASPALYPGDYIFSLTIEGQTDTGIYVSPTDTEVTVSATQYDVIIDSNTANLTTIIVPGNITNATINMTDLMTITDAGRIVNTPANNDLEIQSATFVGEVKMKIPAGTKISATSDSNWTGIINIPTVKLNSSVTVIPDPGNTASVETVIEVGFGDIKLIFDKPVRLLIPGQVGKYAGYSRGGVFTPIATTCSADDFNSVNTQLGAEGDCKIDSGLDLVIWTKHFTKFVIYTQSDIPSPIIYGTAIVHNTTASSISDVDFESAKTTVKAKIVGDTNDDGKVNKYDFALMMADWNKAGLNVLSDLNKDEIVNKYDFALLMVDWSL